jgi:hypothetical protein
MKQFLFSRIRVLGLVTAGVATAALTSAPPAGAAVRAGLIADQSCDGSALTQPFSQWGDSNLYKLLPGGSFEGGASGWTVSGGAQTTSGSEPFGVTGSVGTSSLHLPPGASAQSPFTCVNAAYPTFRLFAHNGGTLSTVLVQVIYREPVIGNVAIPVGTVALSASWSPTAPMLTASAVPGLLSGGTAQVALRFTALTGNSQIDDVFIDPRLHH